MTTKSHQHKTMYFGQREALRIVYHSKGFTLVEALVALVILSATFTATWGWFNTAVRNTTSIERAVRLPTLFDEFIEHLRLVNLKSTRSGTVEIDDYTLVWQANENRVSTQEYYRRQPQWIVTLFDINVEVKQGQQLVTQFTMQQLAQWRDPNYVENPFGAF
mgnify:CR=1 FL=1